MLHIFTFVSFLLHSSRSRSFSMRAFAISISRYSERWNQEILVKTVFNSYFYRITDTQRYSHFLSREYLLVGSQLPWHHTAWTPCRSRLEACRECPRGSRFSEMSIRLWSTQILVSAFRTLTGIDIFIFPVLGMHVVAAGGGWILPSRRLDSVCEILIGESAKWSSSTIILPECPHFTAWKEFTTRTLMCSGSLYCPCTRSISVRNAFLSPQ